MDGSTGKLLNDFQGHVNTSYRCRACFGFNEASVVCGDENGAIWAWDLLDVSIHVSLQPSRFPFFVVDTLVMELGNRFTTEPAPEGPRQSDHLDRAPPRRIRRDGYRRRRWCNQSLVSPQVTTFARGPLLHRLPSLNQRRDHVSDRGSRIYFQQNCDAYRKG